MVTTVFEFLFITALPEVQLEIRSRKIGRTWDEAEEEISRNFVGNTLKSILDFTESAEIGDRMPAIDRYVRHVCIVRVK